MNVTQMAISLSFAAVLAMVACSNTAAGVEQDAGRAAEEAARAADAAARMAAAATETIDVKSALIADRTVDASRINVDTFPETKTIVLKGSVPTATQRDEAARIAAVEAAGYRVDNQLRVEPHLGLGYIR